MTTLDIPTAEVFAPLLEPARYKAAYGGRGSAKSHVMAENLVDEALRWPSEYGEPLYAVCIREVQKTLAQSSKLLIESKIEKFGVGRRFEVQRDRIKTPGGGLIIFQGMQNHTAESIKSLEGFHIAYTDEAQTTSAASLRILRPTLRKVSRHLRTGVARLSELWFAWNPRKPSDPVDQFFRGNDTNAADAATWAPPPDSVVVESNWQHNPWFSETSLVAEKDYDLQRDPDMYAHVWGGGYETNSDAQVFRGRWRVEEFDPPEPGTILYAGADWGYSKDPSVLVVCFIRGRTLYIWREVWEIGCEIDQLTALFDKIDPGWTSAKARDPSWRSLARSLPIIADNARPETISFLKRSGLPRIQPAIKGAGSTEEGIRFLQSYDIVVHPDCTHVKKELTHYSFIVDPHTGAVTSMLADKDNHTIDSLRYALENVRRARSVSARELRM